VPRSFHSLESFAKRNTFARLHQSQRQRQIPKETDEKDIVSGEDWGKVHFELDGLVFLVGGDGDFFQFNQRLKVYIRRLRSLFTLLSHINKLSKTRLEQWPNLILLVLFVLLLGSKRARSTESPCGGRRTPSTCPCAPKLESPKHRCRPLFLTLLLSCLGGERAKDFGCLVGSSVCCARGSLFHGLSWRRCVDGRRSCGLGFCCGLGERCGDDVVSDRGFFVYAGHFEYGWLGDARTGGKRGRADGGQGRERKC
jgi:hypothetical protein